MQTLTDTGDNLVKGISARYGLSYDAVVHMLIADRLIYYRHKILRAKAFS